MLSIVSRLLYTVPILSIRNKNNRKNKKNRRVPPPPIFNLCYTVLCFVNIKKIPIKTRKKEFLSRIPPPPSTFRTFFLQIRQKSNPIIKNNIWHFTDPLDAFRPSSLRNLTTHCSELPQHEVITKWYPLPSLRPQQKIEFFKFFNFKRNGWEKENFYFSQ